MEFPVEVFGNGTNRGVIAARDIDRGEVLLEFEKNFTDQPSNKTLRIGQNQHQLSRNPDSAENFINHSCEANAYIDFTTLALKAARKIRKGEEVTYNYFTSDWDGEDVFECACGASKCKKRVNGFKHLTLPERLELEEYISPFLKEKLNEF